MDRHIMKVEYKEGEKMIFPLMWCGEKVSRLEWFYLDANHATLCVTERSGPPICKACARAIVSELSKVFNGTT